MAEGLLRTVMHNAEVLHTDPRNYDARAEVMWAFSGTQQPDRLRQRRRRRMPHLLEHEVNGMFQRHPTRRPGRSLTQLGAMSTRTACPAVKYAVIMGVTPGAPMRDRAGHLLPRWRSSIASHARHSLGIPTDEQMAEMAASCARACGGAKGLRQVLHQSRYGSYCKMQVRLFLEKVGPSYGGAPYETVF